MTYAECVMCTSCQKISLQRHPLGPKLPAQRVCNHSPYYHRRIETIQKCPKKEDNQ